MVGQPVCAASYETRSHWSVGRYLAEGDRKYADWVSSQKPRHVPPARLVPVQRYSSLQQNVVQAEQFQHPNVVWSTASRKQGGYYGIRGRCPGTAMLVS